MKILLFLLCCFYGLLSNAQRVRFEYDIAGNQVERTWCASCQAGRMNTNYKEIDKLQERDLEKFFSSDVISYYPNPVKEELFIKWDLINGNQVKTIELYSLNGQLIKIFKNNKGSTTQILQFQEYAIGVYLVHLNYKNGDQKSIKIVKN